VDRDERHTDGSGAAERVKELQTGFVVMDSKVYRALCPEPNVPRLNAGGSHAICAAEKHNLREIIAREQTFINSTNPERVETAIRDLSRIQFPILMRKPDFLVGMFENLMERRASMNDQLQTKQLFENGKRHIAAGSWDDLRQVNGRLLDLIPDNEREFDDMRLYTGIV
jgi:hypothetical protein